VLYSVEQLPRCDLLRLSPRLGDSSCRLDETPRDESAVSSGLSNTPRGTLKLFEGPRRQESNTPLGHLVGLRLRRSRRRKQPWSDFGSGGHGDESNTPLGHLVGLRLRRTRRRKQHAARALGRISALFVVTSESCWKLVALPAHSNCMMSSLPPRRGLAFDPEVSTAQATHLGDIDRVACDRYLIINVILLKRF